LAVAALGRANVSGMARRERQINFIQDIDIFIDIWSSIYLINNWIGIYIDNG
jgi:hypothetical protein